MRQATDGDAEFLYALNCQTMRDYVCQTWGDWHEELQAEWFAEHFDPSTTQIILTDGNPIGRLDVLRFPNRHVLRELQISTACQRSGIGTAIISHLLAEARDQRVPLHLQVLKVNVGAKLLYERLGFRAYGETATHVLMQAS
jgi:ribosomal protein S18 acetylase RimI-like enzyme